MIHIAIGLFAILSLQAQTTLAQADGVPAVVERGPHHRVWQSVTSELGPTGETIWHTNSYTELQSGLCYQEKGQWVDASEEIELHPEGAVAQHTQHKVIFAPNLNTVGAIDLLTPDGKRMRSSPVGLAYYDAASGQSVWIGGLKDCQGAVLGANQVIYTNAFSNIVATVRYTVSKAGFEQDVILEEQPPTPESFGLPSDTTRLEVITEFFDSPTPKKSDVLLKHYTAKLGQINFAAPDFVDEQLDFGAMITGRGRAFKLSDQDDLGEGVQVGKRFGTSGGRTYMIEGVEYQAMRQQFSELPKTKNAIRTAMNSPVSQERIFPPVKQLAKTKSPLMVAQSGLQLDSGVVIDYVIVGTTNNMTFRGDTTYYVAGTLYLMGTSVIEGGCVIKYTNAPGCLDFCGPAVTDTSAYHPAIITSMHDNSVGDTISGSTGVPTGFSGQGLWFNLDSDIQYLHFKHLQFGASFTANRTHTISHCTFYKLQSGLHMWGTTHNLRNLLFDNVEVPLAFDAGTNTCIAENITANYASYAFINKNSSAAANISVTNSLFAQCVFLTNAPFMSDHCATNSTTNGVFQIVMNGGSYLADNTYRNLGTTNITPSLLKDLRTGTTYAPVMLTNIISTSILLYPQAQRDTDQPDLGYHFVPIDFMVSNLSITNATLTLTNGVAIGYYGVYGFNLNTDSVFISQGTANNLNRLVHYMSVQNRSGMFDQLTSLPRAIWTQTGNGININLRYTELTMKSRNSGYLFSVNRLRGMAVTDCQMQHGVWNFIPGQSTSMGTLYWTNNLCKRVTMWAEEGNIAIPASLIVVLYNNTFIQSILTYNKNYTAVPWLMCDNLFDNCTLSCVNTSGGCGYNGYVNMGSMTLGGNQNITLASFNYATGSYGGYYQSSTNLINKGSRSAATATLYHYTTQTSNVKETNSVVDIGFHYVAADNSIGKPNDQDIDGIADYLEDSNGNGVQDTGETDWAKNNETAQEEGLLQLFTPLK